MPSNFWKFDRRNFHTFSQRSGQWHIFLGRLLRLRIGLRCWHLPHTGVTFMFYPNPIILFSAFDTFTVHKILSMSIEKHNFFNHYNIKMSISMINYTVNVRNRNTFGFQTPPFCLVLNQFEQV